MNMVVAVQHTTNRARPSYLSPLPAPSTAATVAAGLDRVGTMTAIGRGRTLIVEGDPAEHVFKVVEGALRAVRLLPDGRRYITEFFLPGDYIGLAEGGVYSQSIEAVSEAKLAKYARRRFDAFLDADPRAGKHFFGLVCGELSAAQERLLLLGRKSAVERIATFLLATADRKSADASHVELLMSRSDIADYLGLTNETVSRVLTQLRTDGVIETPSVNHVVFTDRDALEDISSGE